MMTKTSAKTKKKFKPSRNLIIWSVGSCLWLGVLVGVAVPAWRQAKDQHLQVQAIEKQLIELDNWTVAGLWIEKTLGPREAVINPQWDRLFPVEGGKGELFLTLARVADQSGVIDFELKELPIEDDQYSSSENDEVDPLTNAAGEPLATYRVQARFEGQFAEVAEFLGGLKTIDRAVSVHNLAIQPVLGAVHVDLELDVYVRASHES